MLIRKLIDYSDDVRESAATKMNLGATVRVNKCGVGVLVALLLLVGTIYKYGNAPELKREVVSLRNLLSAAIDAAERGGKIVS